MNARTTVANALWYASSWPAWAAFRRALADPAAAQAKVLHGVLRSATRTAFGREHGLSEDGSYELFRSRVPLRTYEELVPWIDRIRAGEPQVLTADPVRRLATTSGTIGGRKLIPHTRGLQRQFDRAIGPWIVDLFQTYPSLLGGPAYWSISPAARPSAPEPSAVPIGFEDDSEYLGGLRRRLVDAVMAVPSSVRRAPTIQAWQTLTTKYLREATGLRLVSIWHPSFLHQLPGLVDRPMRGLWPNLKILSCWADGHAALAAEELAKRNPGLIIQPKGLMATEGVVSIPFAGQWPLAIRSHFYEFIDDDSRVLLAHDLEIGKQYEVVLTTAGGLYRYRLGDLVRVHGLADQTPSIRFASRTGSVSDRFGEKLEEGFVTTVLQEVQTESRAAWRFAMLAPEGDSYVLFIEGDVDDEAAMRTDELLMQNPHYAYCRELGQLRCIRLVRVGDGDAKYLRRLAEMGKTLGDIKPSALSKLDGWSVYFADRSRP